VTNPQKLILVAGATGYIASRLIPQLLDRGYAVRALARNPQRLEPRAWFNQIDIVHADVMEPDSLAPALKDVHTAYYLVHNMSSGDGYTKLETQAALNFARAAEEAGIQHIIYLGGLADHKQPISPHMLSRIETGAALTQGKTPVTEFRASIIAGSGSTSFEMIRFITELFPVIPTYGWLKNRSQPIAVQNIIDYLLAALEKWDANSRILEIGGPEIITYQDLMFRYARVRGYKRTFLFVPYIPLRFTAFCIGFLTPVHHLFARALVRGLSQDSIILRHDAREIHPEVNLMDFESAIRAALACLHPLKIERVWNDGKGYAKQLKHEGFFIDQREIKVDADAEKVFDAITKFIERFFGRRFVVDTIDPDHLLLLRSQLKTPGEGWLEWRVSRAANATCLTQTVFFAPRGTAGFLYWCLLYPIRAIAFQRLIKNIAHNSVVE
jgi:uncharacterized protein YbjT (DUF2867 family)